MSKVSIIIPVYNKGKYVEEAVTSALNQTYKDIELVIIDDCSTDNGYEILKELADKYKKIILLKNEENKGVIYCRNTAIEASTGEYILPLDADDVIEPTYVEKAVEVLNKRPDIGIIYCQYKLIGTKNETFKIPEFNEDYLLFSSSISSCSMFRKKDFIKIGGFKDCIEHGCEDWELWLTFYENGYKFYLINEVMLHYRKIEENTRTNIQIKNICHIRKQLIKNHINLYLNSEEFLTRIFEPTKNEEYKDIYIKYQKEQNKHMEYRKLFKIFLIVAVIEFILIIIT